MFNIQGCNSSNGVGGSPSGTFTFTSATTPGYVADTSDFNLVIYRDSGYTYKIAELVTGVYIGANELLAGTMTLSSYIPTLNTV